MNFRLEVFYQVATYLNFTKAAQEMRISQPAVSKQIHELEVNYGIPLFLRSKTPIELTVAGELLLKHVIHIRQLCQKMDYEMNLLKGDIIGDLKLGASSTIAQYLLPDVVSNFVTNHPCVSMNLLNGNSSDMERFVQEGSIKLAMVEGKIHSNGLKYIPFMKDELVMITSIHSKFANLEEITSTMFEHLPLVLREKGSGTLEIIEQGLKDIGSSLSRCNVLMHLGSTEAIKRFLLNTDAVGIVSIIAVRQEIKEGRYKIIDIESFKAIRYFSFIHKQGEIDGIEKLFLDYMVSLRL